MITYVVCRTNPASSVVIALARNATWMDDAQVQWVFHRLRHDPPPGLRHGPAAGSDRDTMVAQVFERATREIDANPTLGHDCPVRNARVVTASTVVTTNGSSETSLPPVQAVVD